MGGIEKSMGRKTSEEKYILTLTRDQAIATMDALELYARLRIGQFNRITELLLDVQNADDYCKRREIANDLLNIVACVIFGKNAYGHPDCKKDKLHSRMWNIYAALRYKMAWHDHPEGGWTVNFDEPFPWDGEAVPDCKVAIEK